MKNNKKLLISVIIPTWNRGNLLKKAIQSVLNQTIPVLEILICDDGSTDNTFEIVKSIKDKRVKWVGADHTGLPAVVRNRGIKLSKGEWIAFLDSDDEWLPEKLEKQLVFVKKTNCLAVCCNAYGINAKGERKKYLNYPRNTITFSDLLNVNYVILSSAIIHRSLIDKCLGFPEITELKTGQDYAFWLRILTQTDFGYLDEILVNYFDEPSVSIRRFNKDPIRQKKIILKDFLNWCKKSNISFHYQTSAIKCYVLETINSYRNFLRNLK